MTKLCQITALLTGKKTAAIKALTEIYHRFQKPVLFYGLAKRYQPLDEEGETFPDEKQNVQQSAIGCLTEIREVLVGMLDLVATQDKSNTIAKADVKADGRTILADVPVTHLLFLEKQLIDLHTALSAIPVLDPQETWVYDANAACYKSEPTETNKTKKIPRTHVKYDATEQHPAQTEMYHEDVVIGRWKVVKYSSALPWQEKRELLSRIEKLRDGVKLAREEANAIDAAPVNYGSAIFQFILGEAHEQ
jgi:hypothetical protein